jgi:aspartyl-tRNA(Asn)/glutamyl-tRNA(Gln) amidotransferase subunit B
MEEDTGKLIHDGESTLIDFNRSGVPLVEIVTEPDFHNATDVKAYLQKLQQIVRFLGVSNADMEKGDMRLEPNISLRLKGEAGLPKYKVEVKNINSFSFVEKAINFEIKRQSEILDKDEIPAQETRGFVEKDSSTVTQRVKEEASDYRYFPEPDIPPLRWEEKYINGLKKSLPTLPDQALEIFQKKYKLSDYDAEILTRDQEMIVYFEEALRAAEKEKLTPKDIANHIINKKPDIKEVLPAQLIASILADKQITTMSDEELVKFIDEVIKDNEKSVNDFKNGKENAIMFLVGQVMRKAGKIDPTKVKASLLAKIK